MKSKSIVTPDIIIAIDPDIHKSGVAYLEIQTRKLEVSNLSYLQLTDYLQFAKETSETINKRVLIAVEAGWLNKISNYHTAANRRGQRIAKNVGANHQIGKMIVELCKSKGFETIEQKPLKKFWKGKDGKITHSELAAFTGIFGKTNQDGRDAALIAWITAGLPIKIVNKII
jgi:hypothetical protein